MIRKAIKLMLVVVLLLSCFAVLQAQQAEPSPKPEATPKQEVSAAKRALIKEMLDLTNSRQASEAMFSAQFDEMEKQMPDSQWRMILARDQFKKLTPAQQEEVRAKVQEISARQAQRIKELFLQRIDMKQLIDEISYVVYDKHFTEGELRDLVAFYKSATGRKFISELPALFAESIAQAVEFISPKVKEILEGAMRDEMKKMDEELDQLLKTMTKPAQTQKRTSRRRH